MTIKARQFPGGTSNDILTSQSRLTGTTSMSWYFRFNVTAYDATVRRLITWNEAGQGSNGLVSFDNNVITFEADGWTTAGSWSIAGVSAGSEHDLLITYDYAGAPLAWVDGVSVEATLVTASSGTIDFLAPAFFYIGNRPAGGRCFNGWVSTVAIWTNRLLGQTEATALAAGAAPCTIPTNLVAYWPLDRGDSPEFEYVSSNTLAVTGTTVVDGSTLVPNPRCAATGPAIQRVQSTARW